MSGSRKRYLAEQEAFFAAKFDMDVSPQGVRERIAKGSGTIEPGAPVQTKYRMVNHKRVELDPKDYGKDLNPHRAKSKVLEIKRKADSGRLAAQQRIKARAEQDKYFVGADGKDWLKRNTTNRGGKLTWGPKDGKTNRQWRKSQGFGLQRSKSSTGFRGTGQPYAMAKRDHADRNGQLKTSISESDAKKIVDRVGLKGPLPKGLTREQKMAHYEARYVSAGGHKAQKWSRRATASEDARVASVGVGGAAAGAWALTHGKGRIAGKVLRHTPNLKHHAEMTAAGAAVGASAGELYGAHARKKRSSYASAPAGVAASALRRMQAYTPN